MGTDTIVVTGGLGAVGRWVANHLGEEGYRVVCVDLRTPRTAGPAGEVWSVGPETVSFRAGDLTDQGQAWELIDAVDPDGVAHLAAIPRPGIRSDTELFDVNVSASYNVLVAAGRAGARIAWASSDSAYGAVFAADTPLPDYLPIDEAHPTRPEDAYGTSKVVGEEVARMVARRFDVPVASIRPTRVAIPGQYDVLRDIREAFDPATTAPDGGLWSYVDVRDVARVFERALVADFDGHEAFLASAADNFLGRPTAGAIEATYGGLPAECDLSGEASAYSTAKAASVLDWSPRHDWRNAEGEAVEPPAFGAG